MVSTVQIVCTGRKIISQLLKIDGSFFVPYFTLISLSDFTNKDRCTACLYGMVSRIIMLSFFNRVTALLPESECKGSTIFYICKLFEKKNYKNSTLFIKNAKSTTHIRLF